MPIAGTPSPTNPIPTLLEPSAKCLFCKIVNGELPCNLIAETPETYAFLDKSPVFKGHVLVVPKPHFQTLDDLHHDYIAPLFTQAKEVSRAVKSALGAQGTWVSMNNTVSQSVPHLHIHVIPRTKGDGLKGFYWPRVRYNSDQEMSDIVAAIRAQIGAADPTPRAS